MKYYQGMIPWNKGKKLNYPNIGKRKPFKQTEEIKEKIRQSLKKKFKSGYVIWNKGMGIPTPKNGRQRANRLFSEIKPCEICGEDRKRIDRHHKDNNANNNVAENIKFLCRKCHMIVDGRMIFAKTGFGRKKNCETSI